MVLNVLVTGAQGQLGRCLLDQGALDSAIEIDAYDRSELDITHLGQLRDKLKKSLPDYVINAAAYTAVDKAESETERAFDVNETGCLNLATICSELDIPLIHVSTDYVFSGTASMPYKEMDAVAPTGVYGASKLAGEQAIVKTWGKHIIVRTAWVFSEYDNNFVKTMLSLAETRDQLSVVSDQTGNPTYARDIAETLLNICKSHTQGWGIYHYVGKTVASWNEFACAIFDQAFRLGLIKKPVDVQPITTDKYPTVAKRPKYSVLDTRKIEEGFGIKSIDLDNALMRVLERLKSQSN